MVVRLPTLQQDYIPHANMEQVKDVGALVNRQTGAFAIAYRAG